MISFSPVTHESMSRRRFIGGFAKTAAVSLAVPLVLPSRVWSGQSPNSKLNVACIGLGGQMLGSDIREVGQQNIVALCDVDEGRIRETKKLLGDAGAGAREYKDYRKLLETEKSVDAVVIATPDHWHAMIATAAIQAGKHAFCEKPLTHTVAEGVRWANWPSDRRWRPRPATRAARQAISAGAWN